jgi:hypothetical protein
MYENETEKTSIECVWTVVDTIIIYKFVLCFIYQSVKVICLVVNKSTLAAETLPCPTLAAAGPSAGERLVPPTGH